MWNVDTWNLVNTFIAPVKFNENSNIEISPKGSYLVAANLNNSAVFIWEINSQNVITGPHTSLRIPMDFMVFHFRTMGLIWH